MEINEDGDGIIIVDDNDNNRSSDDDTISHYYYYHYCYYYYHHYHLIGAVIDNKINVVSYNIMKIIFIIKKLY